MAMVEGQKFFSTEVKEKLADSGHSLKWLANELNLDYQLFCRWIRQNSFAADIRARIEEILRIADRSLYCKSLEPKRRVLRSPRTQNVESKLSEALGRNEESWIGCQSSHRRLHSNLYKLFRAIGSNDLVVSLGLKHFLNPLVVDISVLASAVQRDATFVFIRPSQRYFSYSRERFGWCLEDNSKDVAEHFRNCFESVVNILAGKLSREKIAKQLIEICIDDCPLFTPDTHTLYIEAGDGIPPVEAAMFTSRSYSDSILFTSATYSEFVVEFRRYLYDLLKATCAERKYGLSRFG